MERPEKRYTLNVNFFDELQNPKQKKNKLAKALDSVLLFVEKRRFDFAAKTRSVPVTWRTLPGMHENTYADLKALRRTFEKKGKLNRYAVKKLLETAEAYERALFDKKSEEK